VWSNGRAIGSNPIDAGSIPATPAKENHFANQYAADEANLVKASVRKTGEIGSKPIVGTIFYAVRIMIGWPSNKGTGLQTQLGGCDSCSDLQHQCTGG
jgi:hypothetical protein